ncbi:zinc-binding dehydrogenase [Saccharopolyspora sp. WRP15-2]|uniref:Zinc-binding dehydrogenase n=1 Tax=Saccharopolyspora oryzae TaxID=2997343 RepID=A0ABT4UUH0_9PSEU|nr:zinc-binding dehydrogenase [Saccharopolyspora oryzae]MDA3624729.1 zinc-binding dehydrogenase [Saccharopolyspora oryzae]
MRTVRFHEFGPPEVLTVEETPVPRPGPGQVLIEAEAVSVGFAQTQMRRDIFPAPMWNRELPSVLGGDVIGRIEAVGPDVRGMRPGDRVGAFTLYGAYADYVVVDADTVLPVPEGLDAAAATALPSSGPIAAGTLDVGMVKRGEVVLVHAASGGIGHISVQMAKAAGAVVVGTAGSPGKCEFVRSLGTDHVVDYSSDDWPDQVRAAVGGVDLVLDSVGGSVLRAGLELLAPMGRLVFYGSAGGGREVPSVSVMDLIRLKYVTAFALSTWRTARREQYESALADLSDGLQSGRFRHAVYQTLDLAEAAKAHALIEARAHTGRIVLIPGAGR